MGSNSFAFIAIRLTFELLIKNDYHLVKSIVKRAFKYRNQRNIRGK